MKTLSALSRNNRGIRAAPNPDRLRSASSPKEPAGETLRLRIALASGWRRWFSQKVLDVAQRLRLRAFRSTAWPSCTSATLAIVGFSGRLLDTAMPRRRALQAGPGITLGADICHVT